MGNIILFIPWGVLFPNLISKLSTFRYTVLSAIIFSLGVEAIQYFMIIGVADIDDVFLNAIGASVGFYTFQLLKRKY